MKEKVTACKSALGVTFGYIYKCKGIITGNSFYGFYYRGCSRPETTSEYFEDVKKFVEDKGLSLKMYAKYRNLL